MFITPDSVTGSGVFVFGGIMGNILSAVMGAVIGAGCFKLSGIIEKILSEKRSLSTEGTKVLYGASLLVSVLCGACLMSVKPSFAGACYGFLLLIPALTAAVMDIKHRIIPNEIILALLAVKAVFMILSLIGVKGAPEFSIISSLIGLAACFVIFLFPSFLGKNVGAGDIKLAAAIGFCLGFKGSLTAIVFMGLLVLLYAVLKPRIPFMAVIKKTIPMGPFLSLGMMAVCILTGYGLF